MLKSKTLLTTTWVVVICGIIAGFILAYVYGDISASYLLMNDKYPYTYSLDEAPREFNFAIAIGVWCGSFSFGLFGLLFSTILKHLEILTGYNSENINIDKNINSDNTNDSDTLNQPKSL